MNWGFFYKHSVRGKHRDYKSIDNSCDKLLFSYHNYSIHIHCVNSVKVKRNKNETAVNFSALECKTIKINYAVSYSHPPSHSFPLFIFDNFSHFLYIFKILWYNKSIMIPAQN